MIVLGQYVRACVTQKTAHAALTTATYQREAFAVQEGVLVQGTIRVVCMTGPTGVVIKTVSAVQICGMWSSQGSA